MRARHLQPVSLVRSGPVRPGPAPASSFLVIGSLLLAGFLPACSEDDDPKSCAAGSVLIGGECVPTSDADADTAPDVDTNTGETITPDADTTDTADTTTTVTLPFAIDDWYKPSGFFPAGEANNIVVAECPSRPADAQGNCHGFTWTPGSDGFAGVWWQYPEGNWGDADGLEVPAGVSAITFWAWGKNGGEKVEFLSGYPRDGFE